MAYSSHSRAVMAELGGKHLHDHKLIHDTPAGIRGSDQRSSSSDDAAPKSTGHTGGRGSAQSTSEEASNEDDEEDSSSAQDDDQEDEEDDPEVLAPSHGFGKGKGKRPAIRIEHTEEDEIQEDGDDKFAPNETGLKMSKHPVNQLLTSNKKRTFSNVSNTSVLFGDDDSEQQSFPRRKMARKLSNSGFKPLLKYKQNANEDMNGSENAIETDDEDYSGVNLVPDDDSDMEEMEQEEESFIIQDEEQQATALINQYNDARRLSLESHASDDIFGITAPLDEGYAMNLPDLGFNQFFETEALPSSPDPITKRKYSDSSTKRVRFDDEVQVSDSSSTSSSELDSSLYPDLFMEQDKLPPSLSQLLENDNDEDNEDFDSPTSETSFWEYGQDEPQVNSFNGADDFDESSDPGSSGYESMHQSRMCRVMITNIMCQLIWAILLMSTIPILSRMLIRRRRFKRSLCCSALLQPRLRKLQARSRSKDLQDRSVALFPQLGAYSSIMIEAKRLPLRIARLRRLPFIVLELL